MSVTKHSASKRFLIILNVICFIAGIGVVWFSIADFTKQGIQTTATITLTTQERHIDSDNDYYYKYYAYIEYQANDILYTTKIPCRESNSIGQTITVYYDAQNPTDVWINRGTTFDFATKISLAFFFILCGTMSLIFFKMGTAKRPSY